MSTALLKEVQMVNYHSDITADEASEKKISVNAVTCRWQHKRHRQQGATKIRND